MKNTDAAIVFCNCGIIGTAKNKPSWIPSDKCIVRFTENEEAVLSQNLQMIHDNLKNDTFDIDEQEIITLQKAHELQTGLPSPKMRTNECKCKTKCTKQCGCHKRQIECSTFCACNGICDNPCNQSSEILPKLTPSACHGNFVLLVMHCV